MKRIDHTISQAPVDQSQGDRDTFRLRLGAARKELLKKGNSVTVSKRNILQTAFFLFRKIHGSVLLKMIPHYTICHTRSLV